MKTFMSFLFFAVNKHSFCASFTETCSTVGIYEFIIKVLEMMRKHFKKTKKMNNKISKLFILIATPKTTFPRASFFCQKKCTDSSFSNQCKT